MSGGQVMDYDLPKDVKVNFIIAVDQPVSQAHDLRPRNLRKVRTLFLGYTVGRLANYLKQAHKSEIKQAVLIQVGAFSTVGPCGRPPAHGPAFAATTSERHGLAYCTSASASACWRKYGLRKPGVLRSTLRPRRALNSSCMVKN